MTSATLPGVASATHAGGLPATPRDMLSVYSLCNETVVERGFGRSGGEDPES